MFLLASAELFSKLTFSENISVSPLECQSPDQDQGSLSLNLGSKCLQKLSEDDKSCKTAQVSLFHTFPMLVYLSSLLINIVSPQKDWQ